MKYRLFNINNYQIDTSKFGNFLHGETVSEFEEKFAEYVGVQYACSANSASSLLQLAMTGMAMNIPPEAFRLNPVCVPSVIPVAVPNIINNLGLPAVWSDDTSWVGGAYTLYSTEGVLKSMSEEEKRGSESFKIVDSSQEVYRGQFSEKFSDQDIVIYSFYPTKPVGGIDGGMVVSNNKEAIDYFRSATNLGFSRDRSLPSWEQKVAFPGWKMNSNSAQCYVALKNLEKLDEKNDRLDQIREKYNDAFGLNNTSRHLYRINRDVRKRFISKMERDGIECGVHYAAVHNYELHNIATPQDMSKSEKDSESTISIPYNESLSEADVDFIIQKVKEEG